MEFELFDAQHAMDEQWREVHALELLDHRHYWKPEWPGLREPTLERMVDRLRDKVQPDSSRSLWVVREGGELVATADYDISLDDADHGQRIAFTRVVVHPARRGRGIGSALLRLLLEQAVRDGKDTFYVRGVRMGTPEDAWTTRLGFEPARRLVYQRMVMAEADPALWDLPTPGGFRLVEQNAACGCDEVVLAAVREADGKTVGTKSVRIAPKADGISARSSLPSMLVGHDDDAVERAMEAAMLRRLAAERPDVTEIEMEKGSSYYIPEELKHYEHRVRICADLGYQREEHVDKDIAVDNLATALANRTA